MIDYPGAQSRWIWIIEFLLWSIADMYKHPLFIPVLYSKSTY